MAGYRTRFASEEVTESEGKERNDHSERRHVNKYIERASKSIHAATGPTRNQIYLMRKVGTLLYLRLPGLEVLCR